MSLLTVVKKDMQMNCIGNNLKNLYSAKQPHNIFEVQQNNTDIYDVLFTSFRLFN